MTCPGIKGVGNHACGKGHPATRHFPYLRGWLELFVPCRRPGNLSRGLFVLLYGENNGEPDDCVKQHKPGSQS
jgi:hypothetical protein